ncbi:MAG: NAD(P)/FAD-dependent oxidoreductase [Planctomycetota bacterium]|jgi:glycine/D-amino acid oxidase-like deaminating enzyme
MKLTNYWNTTTSRPKSKWVGKLPDHSKIVILGAGGAGLTTAVSLALSGAEDVTVIDAIMPSWRGARKGIGVATMFGRQLDTMHKMGFHVREIFRYLKMSLVGMKNTIEFIRRYSNALNNDEWCHAMQYGGFHLAKDDKEASMIEHWQKYLEFAGIKATHMNPQQIERLTSLNVEHDGLFVPNEFMVNPAQYYNGLAVACRKVGVEVLSGYVVTEVYQDGRFWVVADSLGNFIRCDNLIVCTGANLEALPAIDELEDYVTRKRIFYGATPEVSTMRLPPYSISSLDGSMITRRYDNRIIMALDDNDTYPADLKPPKPATVRTAKEKLLELYPISSDNEKQFEYVWAKNSLQTRDALPIVCEIEERPNLFLNVGYGLDSLSWQHIGAAVLKELVLGSKNTAGTELFSLERVKTSEGF